MNASVLRERHISDLHARAADLGVERYRLLSRDELVDAILDKDPDAAEAAVADRPKPKPQRSTRREAAKPAAPEGPVEGKLEISGRGHGFIRLSGEGPAGGDVYVSASQIRRCELSDGDIVAGPARAPRRGERHFALVHVDAVNGEAPGEGSAATRFSELTAVPPTRPIAIDPAAAPEAERGLIAAAAEQESLMFGHRVLVRTTKDSPRTPFVRALAAALGAGEGFETTVVLIDELPEELAAWKSVEGIDLVLAPADLRSREQARIAERATVRAQRAVESGTDVVLVIDSLSRLAAAADDAGFVKPIFGAGRELEEEGAGSLTVIATTIEGAGDDGAVDRSLATTENVLIVLDELLADAGD